MPAHRPRASFEPISPELDVAALVASTENFESVPRIHCSSIDVNGLAVFEKLVNLHVIRGGRPLVIEGYNERLDRSIFSENWLRNHYSTKIEKARDLQKKSDVPLTIGHYLRNLPIITNLVNAYNYKEPDRQRLYLKDIDCPQLWHDHLKRIIPSPVFYLNKNPEAFQGPGSTIASSSQDFIAKSGDLMSCLPPSMRAENLMCYIGHEGTYTPSHQEMCATLGQNLMVEASDGSVEYGKETKPGSSIWFMTERGDRHVVAEYWMSTLGHDIGLEDHFAQINAWRSAPFKTYVVEQKPGDFILVPPLAAHQVWNRGTRTIKVAWNRTTVETLDMALNEALPYARLVCRDEQYKNKAIVFYSLEHYSNLLDDIDESNMNESQKQLVNDFKWLFALYIEILLSEDFAPGLPENDVEYIPFDSNITCSYCRCNIFNRFLTCPWCVSADGEDTYDICMECYVMGRSCACISKLNWAEQFHWSELTEKYELWRQQILRFRKNRDSDENQPQDEPLYQPFSTERARFGRRSLAEICQAEVKRRPWVDITKPVVERVEEKDSDSDSANPARKRRKTRFRHELKEGGRCHICKYIEPKWKLASCSYCNQNYCFGSLFRAFNIQPRDTMEVDWECPKCLKICSCGACRRDPTITPFQPTCMLLGHDTRKIADPRSVESLVDLRQSNLRWLKKVGDDDEGRLRKHQMEADEQRKRSMIEYCIQLEESPPSRSQLTDYGEIPVDPALESLDTSILSPPEST